MALNCSSFNSAMEGTDENCNTMHVGRLGCPLGSFGSSGFSESPAEPEQSIDLWAYLSSIGRDQKLIPLEDIERMLVDVIEVLEARDGRFTGSDMDVSHRSTENTAMENSSIGTPRNTDKKRGKFVPPVDVIDLTSGISRRSFNTAVKSPWKTGQTFAPEGVIDLTGEAVKNPSTVTPRPMEKKGQKFVPSESVIDLTVEESGDSGTLVSLRTDRESPEEAGQEQFVGNKAADEYGDDNEDTWGTSIKPEQEPPEEAVQLFQSPVAKSVATDIPPVSLEHPVSAAESQGDSQAAENYPQVIEILSDDDGDEKDENSSKWGPSMSDKAAHVNADDNKDVSDASRREDEEPPEETVQLFQSPMTKSVATDIPPVSLEHPVSAAESQGDSQAAENCPQVIVILSDDDGDEKDENRSKWGPSMSDKAAHVNADDNKDVSDASRREDEEPPEEAVQLLHSHVAKSVATGIPPVSPPSWKCQQRDFIGSQGGFQAAANWQEEIAFRSKDDDEDNDEKRSQLRQSLEVDVLADQSIKSDDKFIRANHPREFTEEETLCRTGKQRKVNNGGDDLNNLVSYENLHSSLIPFVENAFLPASVKRRKVNHGDDLLHDAGYEQLPIQVERMQVESPFSEDADRAAGHQAARFTPIVENAKSPASVKQQNLNDGVDEYPPIEAVQQVNESMQEESDGHKSSHHERKSGKRGKRDRNGKVKQDKNGKGKAIAEEELEQDEVDKAEEEECAKVEDPNVTEKLKKITAEKVEYEPYVRKICPAEEDPLDDDFNILRIRLMTGSSGQSSDTRTTKSSPEGNGPCKHTNFDFDEVMGFYCGDCGTIAIEMPTSESDPQNKGCLHKNSEFSDEAGKYCSDCGKVLQDIQNCYKADTQIRKGSRKQAQKVQDEHEQTYEIPQVVVTLQGCSGKDDFRGADLELHPSFEKILLLHQKKGFKFLTRNLFGGQQGGYESTGCILEHAPGTGKTCLVISFIQSFLTRFPEGKPLILAPSIMLQSWKDQFERWMVSEVPIYTLVDSARDQDEEDASVAPHVKIPLKEARALKLREWQKGRSILLLSYKTFQLLVSNGVGDYVLPNSLDNQITKALKESANLVILDEGHLARNEDSLITQAILALETKRRVLLSGTLFQNNFEELFTLLKICRDDFMRSDPEFAKKILEYSSGMSSLERKRKELMQIEKKIFMEEIGNRLENWEKLGATSTNGIESVVKKFRLLTSPFVDRYPGEILKTLPGLIEYSIHLNLTTFQSEEIINGLVNSEQVKNHMIRHHKITAACIHPSLALEGEEAGLPFSTRNSSSLQDEARKGVKISFILRLMESSNIAKEKLIIFCSTLRPLKYIEGLCCKIWGWRMGQQILQLDGDMSDVDRQTTIKKFNDTGFQSQVLLASTKACKEGISLVGASRVVILDCLENPSVIRQAVSRAFRMGQKKKVYVYRLVTTHSFEVQVFKRSVSKEKLSFVLLDPVSTKSNLGEFLQEQRASDVEDELLRDVMLDDRVNGGHIDSVQRYNAGG